MDPYEDAPACAAVKEQHTPAENAPASVAPPPSSLPKWESGQRSFPDLQAVLQTVRELHSIEDPVVAPHKSKYAARIIMTDILTQLKPLLNNADFKPEELQWVKEQIGRLEYLNGVNHIEAEETSAGERMLSKGLLKFKDNPLLYPYDILDGYNHLAIVWSNRGQHTLAYTYLQFAQRSFLTFKKLRAATLDTLSEEDRKKVEELDREQQEKVEEEEEGQTEGDKQKEQQQNNQAEGKEQEEEQKERENESNTTADESKSDEAQDGTSSSSSSTSAAPSSPLSPFPSLSPSLPGARFVDPVLWHELEVTHTLTLFFLAQVFGHLKKRDLAAIYCHLCLNRQLKQRKDFNRREWVTNAIGLSFYYSGRKMLKQAHHCLLAAQHFIPSSDFLTKMNTATADTTPDQQLAADLCRAWGAFYLKWLQRSRDQLIESPELLPQMNEKAEKEVEKDVKAAAAGSSASSSTSSSSSTDDAPADPSTSLASLPEDELAELKRLQRLDRERERHFEAQVEEEADEDEDEMFGAIDISGMRKDTSKDKKKEKKKVDRTLPSSLTPDEQEAVREELKKNVEETAPTSSSSSSPSPAPTSPSNLLIEFKSLNLPPSPECILARNYASARHLFKQSLDWFHRASLFYILDGYVSDHIPIMQDMSLLYKLLSVFDLDLSRQCKMHKRRIDLLTPIFKQLSVASYQEFFQQLADELANTYADMMDLKMFILNMKVKLLGAKFNEKKREDAQSKINELALKAIQFYSLWLQSWSKDGKEVQELDEYYHRWYLMAMFKIARCYSKIYHSDPTVLNTFTKKALDQYKAVVAKAEQWRAEDSMQEELALCREMVQLLPFKMDRAVAKGSFRV